MAMTDAREMSNPNPKGTESATIGAKNTRATAQRAWNVWAASQKMYRYHQRLTAAQREDARASGKWSDEQRAALEAAGLM